MARPKHIVPGPGRRKGYKMPATLEKEAIREAMRLVYAAHAEEMVLAQIQAAKGYQLIDKSDKDGKAVFDVEPNASAWNNLTVNLIGKLKEEVDVTSGGEKLPTPIIVLKRDT